MRSLLVLLLLVFLSTPADAQQFGWQPSEYDSQEKLDRFNLPKWIHETVDSTGQNQAFTPVQRINPYLQTGDFNGDGALDWAVFVKRRDNGKEGILIVHGQMRTIKVVGAGNEIGAGGENFEWMTNWEVHPEWLAVPKGVGESEVIEPKGDGLHVSAFESGGGLIYWTGKKYNWYQQGD
jgi:hypothetical protein